MGRVQAVGLRVHLSLDEETGICVRWPEHPSPCGLAGDRVRRPGNWKVGSRCGDPVDRIGGEGAGLTINSLSPRELPSTLIKPTTAVANQVHVAVAVQLRIAAKSWSFAAS